MNAQVITARQVDAGMTVRRPGRPGNEQGTIVVESVMQGEAVCLTTILGVNHRGERIQVRMDANALVYRL